MTDAAVVAFYGEGKPTTLRGLVDGLHRTLTAGLGATFGARDPHTVHTTVIGLDSAAGPSRRSLGALLDDGGTDLAGLARHLTRLHPLTLQYGGHAPDRPGLRSRGLPLHERSLVRSGNDVVLLGWPLDDAGEPCLALHDLRVAAATYGFAHRYPLSAAEPDPDAHLVIGTLRDDVDAASVEAVLAQGRRDLAGQRHRVTMGPEDLAVVLYTEKDLTPGSTTVVPLAEVASGRPGEAPTAP